MMMTNSNQQWESFVLKEYITINVLKFWLLYSILFWPKFAFCAVLLTLVLLNPDKPCLCKQCRSRSVGFCRSQLIWICTVCNKVCEFCINNLDQAIWLAENLKLAWHLNLFSWTRVKILSGMANSVDLDQTAPEGAVWAGSALFKYAFCPQFWCTKVWEIYRNCNGMSLWRQQNNRFCDTMK